MLEGQARSQSVETWSFLGIKECGTLSVSLTLMGFSEQKACTLDVVTLMLFGVLIMISFLFSSSSFLIILTQLDFMDKKKRKEKKEEPFHT